MSCIVTLSNREPLYNKKLRGASIFQKMFYQNIAPSKNKHKKMLETNQFRTLPLGWAILKIVNSS